MVLQKNTEPGGPGSIPGGVRNFNSYPGIGCVSFVFCTVLSPAEALTLCRPHIQGGPPLSICLVFWSIDNCSPYRHLTHGHLGCKFLWVKVLDRGTINTWRRKKERERKRKRERERKRKRKRKREEEKRERERKEKRIAYDTIAESLRV